MAKKQGQEKLIKEMIQLGEENRKLYRKVRNWCRNLEIKISIGGLVAEHTGLPIGMVSMSCNHAQPGGVESMHLKHVAAPFIIRNCRGCPHHEIISSDNFGSQLLQELEKEENKKAQDVEDVQSVRNRIKELVPGDLKQALKRAETTRQSVLELVALLEDEQDCVEAAKKLVKASEIAPELFIELAIDAICSYFSDEKIGPDCVTCVRNLSNHLGGIPNVAFQAAKKCLLTRENASSACYIIGDYAAQEGLAEVKPLVDAIIVLQSHQWVIGNSSEDIEYPESNYALTKIGQISLKPIVDALSERLKINKKSVRINASGVIKGLLKHLPELGKKMVKPLVKSFELDDDHYEDSADARAAIALAEIYMLDPSGTHEALQEAYAEASNEVKQLIYSVYDKVIRGAIRPSGTGEEETAAKRLEYANTIVPILFQGITVFAQPVEVKRTAADTLSLISDYRPEAAIEHLDGIIGAIGILIEEKKLASQKKIETPLAVLEGWAEESIYDCVINNLIESIGTLAEAFPEKVFNAIQQSISGLNSKQAAMYKSELVRIYGKFAKQHEQIPRVIPELYKHLMDFDSVEVRGGAVQALGDILMSNKGVVPQDMIDALAIHLMDTYVYVHKSAVHAMRFAYTSDIYSAKEICERLLNLERLYKKDPYFLEKIIKSLVHIARPYKSLLRTILPVVVKHCRIEEPLIADDILECFERILEEVPEFASIYVREVLLFYGRTDRDRYNDDRYSTRYRLLEKIYELPRESLADNLEFLKENVRAKMKEDPRDAWHLIELLSHFEFHREAADLAQEIVDAQPQTKRYEWVVTNFSLIAALESAELMIQQGQFDEAIKILSRAQPIKEQEDEDEQEDNPADSIQTTILAEKLAERLT